ncbi:hypothetical protein EBZ39_02695 [bacterium]|nr:hypothetical protein [bacterium]
MSLPNESAGKVWATPETATFNFQQNANRPLKQFSQETAQSSPFATSAYIGQTRPASDPYSKLRNYVHNLADKSRIRFGVIMDGTPIANCYRVQVEEESTIVAAPLTRTGGIGNLGAVEINTYSPGTPVFILLHEKYATGFILGALPYSIPGVISNSDYVSQTTRTAVDYAHKKHIDQFRAKNKDEENNAPQNTIIFANSGRPLDLTLGNEWGATARTGIGITLDDFMVKLAVNEFTGIFGFYHDQLLRVAGYNLQVWTAGHEREAFMDQAEYNDTQGYSPYPWEAVGVLNTDAKSVQEYSFKTYQCPREKPYYAHWENKNEFQQPYHRTQHFFGYLGQGGRTQVHAPPAGLDYWTYKPGNTGTPEKVYEIAPEVLGLPSNCEPGDKKLTTHQVKPAYGLHEDNVGLDGRRFIASAKGIVLSKRILLPVPQRLKRPEDSAGDNASSNYKASGKFGAGDEHVITGDINATDKDWPNLQRAAGILDLHAYLFNYSGAHAFYWHAQDYKVWEQSELVNAGQAGALQKIPAFAELRGSMYLKQPQPKSFKIDHRYKEQNFYETESFVSLLEDGSVVIGDGYGAEIRMSGGCLTLSAPGDVWIKSGRHAQIWSGSDCIVRANESIDLSTTNKSVRVKSEKHIMMMAGNDEVDGGILLESRAANRDYDFEKCGDDVSFGGVVLRAPNSNIVGVGNQIYLRTAYGSRPELKPGEIVLDAGQGQRDIITKSNNIFNFVNREGAVYQFFGLTDAQKANMFSEQVSLLSGLVGTESALFVGGGILSDASIFVKSGHIFTDSAAKGGWFVSGCDDDCKKQVDAALSKIRKLIDKELPILGGKIDQSLLETQFWGEKKPGNENVIDLMEFSFRTEEQYGVKNFLLYEDRWQQMAKLSGETTKKWTERGVSSKICDETYPFPGRTWLVDKAAYMQQKLNLVTKNAGGLINKDRGAAPKLDSAYSTPEFTSDATKIDGNYPIIGRD